MSRPDTREQKEALAAASARFDQQFWDIVLAAELADDLEFDMEAFLIWEEFFTTPRRERVLVRHSPEGTLRGRRVG